MRGNSLRILRYGSNECHGEKSLKLAVELFEAWRLHSFTDFDIVRYRSNGLHTYIGSLVQVVVSRKFSSGSTSALPVRDSAILLTDGIALRV